MKIARKHIVQAIEQHQDTMDGQGIPPSRQYVTAWDFKKYRLTVKRLKRGWRILWHKRKKRS